jgi:para-nitrobenzyl esterase
VVNTTGGPVRGAAQGGVLRFLGIPYASPPVGEQRWRPPTAAAPWTKPRETTRFGSSCVQPADFEGPGSEDCLFLNVWTPEAPSDAPKPVLFYIHGGGWVRGAGNMSGMAGIDNTLDGQHLAETEGVVVVTLNYRLGALGFLAHPAFRAESASQSTGNYGLLDVLFALEWVRQNVREFGGDPDRVMVFGTSAGGSQTCAVAASPLAEGLFAVAAAHSSGGCDCFAAETGAELATQLAEMTNCTNSNDAAANDAADVAACLREVPAQTLVNLPSSGAIADGSVLPQCPQELFADGGGNPVPLIFGTTAHEGMLYLNDAARALTWDAFHQLLGDSFGAAAGAAIAAVYPTTDYDSAAAAWMMFASDWIFHCPDRRVLRALQGRPEPTYRFVFGGILSDPRHAANGAIHGTDVPFVFGNFGDLETTPNELALSARMGSLWANIARSGGKPPKEWAPWDEGERALGLGLDDVAMISGHRDAQCDELDKVPSLRETALLPFP